MRSAVFRVYSALIVLAAVCPLTQGLDPWGRQLVALRGKKKVQVYNNPTATAFSSDWTPIRVRLGKDFNSSTVTMCKLDWKKRAEVGHGLRNFLWWRLSNSKASARTIAFFADACNAPNVPGLDPRFAMQPCGKPQSCVTCRHGGRD